jgi:hypothetical protein
VTLLRGLGDFVAQPPGISQGAGMANKPVTLLTKQQKKLLEFIGRRLIRDGVQPTYRDIAKHFGFASQNGVVCHMNALIRKGYVTRLPGQSRAIRINWSKLGMNRHVRMVPYLIERFNRELSYRQIW